MPHRYRYTGRGERVFLGLQVGVNAEPERPAPAGSTVTLRHGERVTTSEPYPHRQLEPVDAPKTRKSRKGAKSSPLPLGDAARALEVLRTAAEGARESGQEPSDPESASTEEQE